MKGRIVTLTADVATETVRGWELLHGRDLRVDAGAVVILIGSNGSGRTTLLELLAGLAHSTSGTVQTLGIPLEEDDRAACLRRIGTVIGTRTPVTRSPPWLGRQRGRRRLFLWGDP